MDPKLFGSRIRQARERLAMSQEELGVLVSKDQRAISEYENGRRKLSSTDLPQFAAALQVPLLYFFEGEVDLNDFDRAILHEFHRLPTTETRRAAIQMIRILADAVGLQPGD